MFQIPDFDLTNERGKQDFNKWITFNIKNEINSYARQSLALPNASITDLGGGDVSSYYGNLDGGAPISNYGGIAPIDLGGVT